MSGYKTTGATVTIDGVKWKKDADIEYGKVILADRGKRYQYRPLLDHSEIFKNKAGEYALASHIYDMLYSDNNVLDKLEEIKDFANEHNLDVKIEPVKSWYSPRYATLIWWTPKTLSNQISI